MLLELAAALSDALERETAALVQGDYDCAARLAPAKLAALKAFTEALAEQAALPATPQQAGSDPEGDVQSDPELLDLRDILERLRGTALANRVALECALAVQGRVVEAITGALKTQSGALLGYGSAGQVATAPFVLSMKA